MQKPMQVEFNKIKNSQAAWAPSFSFYSLSLFHARSTLPLAFSDCNLWFPFSLKHGTSWMEKYLLFLPEKSKIVKS